MGYLFVAVALLAGATKGYCGKKTSGITSGYSDATLFNFIRMLFCIIIGFGVLAFEGNIAVMRPSMGLIAVTALSGVATSLFVVSWLVSVKKGAYMMIDVFLMLGTLVPLILGKIFFNEEIGIKVCIGFFILLIAVIIMCSYNNTIKERLSPSAIALLVIAGLANGFADFSQKLFVSKMQNLPISVFNFYTYIFSALTLAVVYAFFKVKYVGEATEKKGVKSAVFYILIMSVCLFVNSYFKTAAAVHLDSAKLYPLNQGLALVISLLMSSILFGEKLTVRAIIGVVMAFVGLLILNVL